MKKIILLILNIIIMFNLFSCKNLYAYSVTPAKQENTYWTSEKHNIKFYVDENRSATGEIIIDDEIIDIVLWFDPDSGMSVYSVDIIEDSVLPYEHNDEFYQLEEWSCFFISKNKFIATVEESTYFDVGDRIVFEKVKTNPAPDTTPTE